MDAIPPTIPFHLARAYTPGTPAAPQAAAVRTPGTIARSVQPIRPLDTVERATPSATPSPKAKSLVAARVNANPLDEFSPSAPRATSAAASARVVASSTPAAYPLYRHPTDKNAAATAVDANRIIDTSA